MDIEVKMGDVAVADRANNLITSGVGSCLVIMLYDPKLRIGACAHAMLPAYNSSPVACKSPNKSGKARNKVQDRRYVDVAIDEIVKKMSAKGSKREYIEAKIVGGANMFSAFESDIGRDNISSAKEKLKKEEIRLVGESVGGSQGKSVEFSVATGIVTVKTVF